MEMFDNPLIKILCPCCNQVAVIQEKDILVKYYSAEMQPLFQTPMGHKVYQQLIKGKS